MEVWAKNSSNRSSDTRPLKEPKKTRKVNQASTSENGLAEARSEVLQKEVAEAKKQLLPVRKLS